MMHGVQRLCVSHAVLRCTSPDLLNVQELPSLLRDV